MPLSCTPSDLAAEATCFECQLSDAQRAAIQTYLLAVIAGGSTDPQTLLTAASQFQNLSGVQLAQIQAYLLCAIVNK
jgi:hypothetical protein